MSSIEFKYFEYLNKNNIVWIKPKPLKYFLNDKQHLYFPDFYLPETDEYIEIKGYMWPKDEIKMKQVILNNPLINLKVINKFELELLSGTVTQSRRVQP